MFQRVASVLATAIFLIAADGPTTGLSIHEWGTFTSVAGEDGSSIDWDSLACPDDLPRFVNEYGYRGFKFRLTGTVRMETPVMYFYSPRELTARVTVQFPQGLITEWYPKAHYSVFQDGAPLAANINGIDTSLRKPTGMIEWRDRSATRSRGTTAPFGLQPRGGTTQKSREQTRRAFVERTGRQSPPELGRC
jgi:hypothetical protein